MVDLYAVLMVVMFERTVEFVRQNFDYHWVSLSEKQAVEGRWTMGRDRLCHDIQDLDLDHLWVHWGYKDEALGDAPVNLLGVEAAREAYFLFVLGRHKAALSLEAKRAINEWRLLNIENDWRTKLILEKERNGKSGFSLLDDRTAVNGVRERLALASYAALDLILEDLKEST